MSSTQHTNRIEIGTTAKAGAQGFQGWSPVLATQTDGSRIVLKVIDWTGGLGPKPPIGSFIGSTGLVAAIATATDIRGASDVGDTVYLAGSVTTVAKNHSYYCNKTTANIITLPAITAAMGFEFQLLNTVTSGVSLTIPPGFTVYKASSRTLGSAFEEISFTMHTGAFSFPKGVFQIKCFTDGTLKEIYIF